MMLEEAIRECEFWTTNVPGSVAIGSTRKPEVGMYFNAPSIEAEGATDPHGPAFGASRSVACMMAGT